MQREPSADRSFHENPPLGSASGALGETGIGHRHAEDLSAQAAADVEQLLADSPALRRIVDLAAELAQENAAGAGEWSELPGGAAPRRAGGTPDQR